MAATGHITAVTKMNPSYLPGGANVHPLFNALFFWKHYVAYFGTYGLNGTGSFISMGAHSRGFLHPACKN